MDDNSAKLAEFKRIVYEYPPKEAEERLLHELSLVQDRFLTPQLLSCLAIVAGEIPDEAKVSSYLKMAWELDPESHLINVMYANTLFSSGKFLEAMSHYFLSDKNDSEVWYVFGLCLLNLNQPEYSYKILSLGRDRFPEERRFSDILHKYFAQS